MNAAAAHSDYLSVLRQAFGEPDGLGFELVWSIAAARPVGGRIRIFLHRASGEAPPVARVETDGMPGGDLRIVTLEDEQDVVWLAQFVASRSCPGAVRLPVHALARRRRTMSLRADPADMAADPRYE